MKVSIYLKNMSMVVENIRRNKLNLVTNEIFLFCLKKTMVKYGLLLPLVLIHHGKYVQ
jgi:hypothetical protein